MGILLWCVGGTLSQRLGTSVENTSRLSGMLEIGFPCFALKMCSACNSFLLFGKQFSKKLFFH